MSELDQSGETETETMEVMTVGRMLRTARTAQTLALETIAAELRIDLKILEALEDDRQEDIAMAPVFVRGYIKQYGRRLGLDAADLTDAVQRDGAENEVRIEPNRTIRLRDGSALVLWVVILVLALGIGGAAWYFLFMERAQTAVITPPAASMPATRSLAPNAPSLPARPASVAERDSTEPAPEPVSIRAGSPAAVAQNPAAPGAPGSAAELADGAAARPGSATALSTPPAPADPGSPADPVAATALAEADPAARPAIEIANERLPESLEISLSFSADSWVEIEDALGRQVFYDMGDAGSEYLIYPVPPARVLLGYADGVGISIAGEAYQIPGPRRLNGVASFVIPATQD